MTVNSIGLNLMPTFLLPCPSRGMTWATFSILWTMKFLLPCPSRGMTRCLTPLECILQKFLLPCPSRGMTRGTNSNHSRIIFLLPCPSRGMTNRAFLPQLAEVISTPMPLAGHDIEYTEAHCLLEISTPMPLAGHDGTNGYEFPSMPDFYSHAPRGA